MADITPEPRVQMDPNYQKRFEALQAHAAATVAARRQGGAVAWNRPVELTEPLFRYQALAAPFDRAAANQQGIAAISDPANPGVTGDVVAAVTMIETLSAMERALRMRYTMSRCRAVAHGLGRLKGHGDPAGVLAQNGIEYVSQILRQARAPE